MAKWKAKGSPLCVLLFAVLCLIASSLPTGLARLHLSESSDSLKETQNGYIEKVPVQLPGGPSLGTYPDDLAMAVPGSSSKFIRKKLPVKRILKSPVNPPSGPSGGNHPDELPMPAFRELPLPPPYFPPIKGIQNKNPLP